MSLNLLGINMNLLYKLFFAYCLTFNTINAEPTPVVLWHGMGDTCCFSFSLGYIKTFIEKQLPGVYVESLMFGTNKIDDFSSGYFMPADKQIEHACGNLTSNPKLANGFNAIGFSQGGQFMRGLVQRCTGLKVKNLISLGGQHQGVFGIPNCPALKHDTCEYIRELLNVAAYESWLQKSLVQASYWHDPLHEATYKEKSEFIAEINNERVINQTYIDNLRKLEHFIMVKFDGDTIVQPPATEWFGFYKPGQDKVLETLQESDIYIQDRLGLKSMDKQKKLIFISNPDNHLQFTDTWFKTNILDPYLKN